MSIVVSVTKDPVLSALNAENSFRLYPKDFKSFFFNRRVFRVNFTLSRSGRLTE